MKLNEKDKSFLERLKQLIDQDAVWIERTFESPLYFVLRGNYGDRVERLFKLTRQGVRWRFWRLFNDIYVSAYDYGELLIMWSWALLAIDFHRVAAIVQSLHYT